MNPQAHFRSLPPRGGACLLIDVSINEDKQSPFALSPSTLLRTGLSKACPELRRRGQQASTGSARTVS